MHVYQLSLQEPIPSAHLNPLHLYIHIYTYMYVHEYMYTYTYTHAYMCTNCCSESQYPAHISTPSIHTVTQPPPHFDSCYYPPNPHSRRSHHVGHVLERLLPCVVVAVSVCCTGCCLQPPRRPTLPSHPPDLYCYSQNDRRDYDYYTGYYSRHGRACCQHQQYPSLHYDYSHYYSPLNFCQEMSQAEHYYKKKHYYTEALVRK